MILYSINARTSNSPTVLVPLYAETIPTGSTVVIYRNDTDNRGTGTPLYVLRLCGLDHHDFLRSKFGMNRIVPSTIRRAPRAVPVPRARRSLPRPPVRYDDPARR